MIKKYFLLSLIPLTMYSSQNNALDKSWLERVLSSRFQVTAHDYTPIYQNNGDFRWKLGDTCESIYNVNDKKTLNLTSFFTLWAEAYRNMRWQEVCQNKWSEEQISELRQEIGHPAKNFVQDSDYFFGNARIVIDSFPQRDDFCLTIEKSLYDIQHLIKENKLPPSKIKGVNTYIIQDNKSYPYPSVDLGYLAGETEILQDTPINTKNSMLCANWITPGETYEVEPCISTQMCSCHYCWIGNSKITHQSL